MNLSAAIATGLAVLTAGVVIGMQRSSALMPKNCRGEVYIVPMADGPSRWRLTAHEGKLYVMIEAPTGTPTRTDGKGK